MAKSTKMFHRKCRWLRVTALMARDGNLCAICGEELSRSIRDYRSPLYITFDHKVPRSHGGLDVVANLRLAHLLCNSERGNDPIAPADEES